MENEALFLKNIRKVVEDCCAVKKGERVLIISDIAQESEIYLALYQAAVALEAQPSILILPVAVPGKELPDVANEACMQADVIITPTTTSIYHAPGIHRACTKGHARLQALSECNINTFLQGGINADFKAILPVVELVGQKYETGSKIHYTTPAGTNITALIAGRQAFCNSGICATPGEHMGLPTIEVFIAPVEDSVEGEIVVDLSCSAGIGIIEDPIHLKVEKGKAISISGGAQAVRLKEILEKEQNQSVFQIAELAIGLNPQCRITGVINEDEGKYGTCHMALGSNSSFGGQNQAPLHIDMVQNAPTIEIDGEIICKDGELLIADVALAGKGGADRNL